MASDKFVYNSGDTIEENINKLCSLMTVAEKAGQLQCHSGWKVYEKNGEDITITDDYKACFLEAGIGGLYGFFRADPWTQVTLENGLNRQQAANAYNKVQRFVIEHSRLGIPLLISEECLHGLMAIEATTFPTAIGLASAWNTDLVREIAKVTALESRSVGVHIGYGPILDVARDPRWCRVEETYGEDPFLISQMGKAVVQGFQGDDLTSSEQIVATLKHFAAYAETEGGHNASSSHIGQHELHEIHLRPFRDCVKEGALSAMTAYNDVDGIPCTCHKKILTDTLRNEWGFEGFVVSDAAAIPQLIYNQRVAKDRQEACFLTLDAGCESELYSYVFKQDLINAVNNGIVSMGLLDQAVKRILMVKAKLGLFENPYVDEKAACVQSIPKEHHALALKAAQQSITLLKNEQQILPLSKQIANLAIIGPNADDIGNQLGDYTSPQPEGKVITLLKGIQDKLGNTAIHYAKGCGIRSLNRDGIDEAVAAAEKSDAIIAVVGSSSKREYKHLFEEGGQTIVDPDDLDDMDCGEGIDRATLDLSGLQLDLLKALKETGKPLIVVLIQGRPMTVNWIKDNADAILLAWYPGEMGGAALADVLFGDYNPGGKLPISIPRHVGQLPVFYNHRNDRRKDYVDLTSDPLFSFSDGLSYTTFSYSNLQLSTSSITVDQQALVSVDVQNVGKYDGDEIVQLYIRDEFSKMLRPFVELKGFKRIHLKAGEKQTVSFEVGQEQLEYYGPDETWVVEPGQFVIMVGGNLKNVTATILEVV